MAASLDIRDRVAYLTLDRPDAMNAIDEAMLSELTEALVRIREDETVKALVVTGAGKAFCIGLDIGLLRRAFSDPKYFEDVLVRYGALLLMIEWLPIPVIAAVNGRARAGGFELLLACDMAIIADEAIIADHHLAFGIVPGGGSTFRLPRRIGYQRAREIIFTGRWLTGPEAVEYGLALRSVPAAVLPQEIESLAGVFRHRSRPALAATKRAMQDQEGLITGMAMEEERRHFMHYLTQEKSAREGFDAFVEQRDPEWE